MRRFGVYLIIAAILSVVLPFVGLSIKVLTDNLFLTIIAAVVGIVLVIADRN